MSDRSPSNNNQNPAYLIQNQNKQKNDTIDDILCDNLMRLNIRQDVVGGLPPMDVPRPPIIQQNQQQQQDSLIPLPPLIQHQIERPNNQDNINKLKLAWIEEQKKHDAVPQPQRDLIDDLAIFFPPKQEKKHDPVPDQPQSHRRSRSRSRSPSPSPSHRRRRRSPSADSTCSTSSSRSSRSSVSGRSTVSVTDSLLERTRNLNSKPDRRRTLQDRQEALREVCKAITVLDENGVKSATMSVYLPKLERMEYMGMDITHPDEFERVKIVVEALKTIEEQSIRCGEDLRTKARALNRKITNMCPRR